MALAQAAAGVDMVGPSGMMDGQVGVVRRGARRRRRTADVSILAYSAKYASAFFGPFREAVDSSLEGDRRTYQQDPANAVEGVREALLDVEQGADIVMVKPALAYLDVVRRVRDAVDVPVAAYNVSGEYAMVEAAAAHGWIDREAAILETLTSIRRAGADVILTYWAAEAAAPAAPLTSATPASAEPPVRVESRAFAQSRSSLTGGAAGCRSRPERCTGPVASASGRASCVIGAVGASASGRQRGRRPASARTVGVAVRGRRPRRRRWLASASASGSAVGCGRRRGGRAHRGGSPCRRARRLVPLSPCRPSRARAAGSGRITPAVSGRRLGTALKSPAM